MPTIFIRTLVASCTIAALSPPVAAEEDRGDTGSLRREIEQLKDRLQRLEEETVTASTAPGSERAQDVAAPAQAEPDIHVGGALRFNLVHRNFADSSDGKRGESGLDVFRLNVDGEIDDIVVSAEYRFYSYMHTLHHGWIGYQFSDSTQLQFGVNQVPFGLLPYPAHNAWFGIPYYVGLGDDYDMGIKYLHSRGPWSVQLAFYKNEELNDATDAERYSFDLIRDGDQQNEEINQLNARATYTFGHDTICANEVGASLQAGEIYNTRVNQRGDRWAGAAHLDSRCGRWNVQLKAIRYQHSPTGTVDTTVDTVQVGAFDGTYMIADEADILVANLAFNVPSPWARVNSITCYNDYSRLYKSPPGMRDSQVNTIGCAIGSGPLFTYVDYILANNMAYFQDGSMAGGGEDEWHGRFNVNIGFYW